jgi:hypothetical protein
MAEVPDKELRQRNYKCVMANGLSPAEIQVCKNIRRECDERAKGCRLKLIDNPLRLWL